MTIQKTDLFAQPSINAQSLSLLRRVKSAGVSTEAKGTKQAQATSAKASATAADTAAKAPCIQSRSVSPSMIQEISQGSRQETAGVSPVVVPSAVDAAATAESPATGSGSGPITLEQLQQAIGTNNPQFDLDGNGTVDIDDLVTFIRHLSDPAPNPAPNPADDQTSRTGAKPAPPPTSLSTDLNVNTSRTQDARRPPSSPLTIEGFHRHNGESGGDYDINNDGTVNIDDLVQFITNLHNPQPGPVGPEKPNVGNSMLINPGSSMPDQGADPATSLALVPSAAPTATSTSTPPLTLDGLLHAMNNGSNTARTPYDLNSDGHVNIDDLVQFITGLTPGSPGESKAAVLPAQPDADKTSLTLGAGSSKESNAVRTQKLVDSLIDKLNQAGFASQPPTNIRELVGALDLSPAQSNTVMGKLQQRYPAGLGVNMVA